MADVPLICYISGGGGQLPISCSPFCETAKLIHSQLLWQAKVSQIRRKFLDSNCFRKISMPAFFFCSFFLCSVRFFLLIWFRSIFLRVPSSPPKGPPVPCLPNNLSPAPRDWWCSHKDGHIVIMSWDMDSILIYQLELHILGVSPGLDWRVNMDLPLEM